MFATVLQQTGEQRKFIASVTAVHRKESMMLTMPSLSSLSASGSRCGTPSRQKKHLFSPYGQLLSCSPQSKTNERSDQVRSTPNSSVLWSSTSLTTGKPGTTGFQPEQLVRRVAELPRGKVWHTFYHLKVFHIMNECFGYWNCI